MGERYELLTSIRISQEEHHYRSCYISVKHSAELSGSPVLFQSGDPPESFNLLIRLVFWTGLITIGVGIVMLGGEKGRWGDLGKRFEEGVSNEGTGRTYLKERDIKSMKIAAMVLRILGSVVIFRVGRRGGIGRTLQRDYRKGILRLRRMACSVILDSCARWRHSN